MELCSQNLQNIIAVKGQVFDRQPETPMDCIEYYISSQLMVELTECVEYLHTSRPPVIHRDLKPSNILIIDRPVIGNKFLKLGDFGLATDHNRNADQISDSHSVGKGTSEYMAPEVYRRIYNVKCDIYSLAIIYQDMFDIDIDDYNNYRNSSLYDYVENLSSLIISMMCPVYSQRPSCTDILNKSSDWLIDRNFIEQNTSNLKQTIKRIGRKQFFGNYLFYKTM
ncbi:putative mitogen-activated protein kinase kinase kinase 7-like [Oppia nitens]|uniref:putative mitogen-activated protein kinase kinase kinase 7-like n=1 Tax=Oppia nitens TaxID=1686743 RepID=UPI0023DC19A9|nr:putative mitogen-activated protein kinase kinase kinase 7-like [Oppia nitens]